MSEIVPFKENKRNEIFLEKEPQKPCLILAQAEIPQIIEVGRQYELEEAEYILSNSKEADIQIPSTSVPEHRLRLYFSDAKWRFENLSERKEVYINRSLNEEGVLQDGDFLQIGDTAYEFLAGVGWQSGIYYAMHQAIRVDAHTKAFNKAHFWESIERWVSISERHQMSLSIFMIDLDDFKQINTNYGHLAADEMLKFFSHRVRTRIRKEDSFYRMGGEEFVAILPETTKEEAIKLAEEIRLSIEKEPFLVYEHEILLTLSIGVATYANSMTKENLYRMANERMREAKRIGKNRVIS